MNEITTDHLAIGVAATEFSIPYQHLYDACRSGTLPCVKEPHGKRQRTYVLRDDLQLYLDRTRKLPGTDCPNVEPDTAIVKEGADQAAAQEPNNGPSQKAENEPHPSSSATDFGSALPRKKGRKNQLQLVKDSMRKLAAPELIKISIWINARLERAFANLHPSEFASASTGARTAENDH